MIACGSECGRIYTYSPSWSRQLAASSVKRKQCHSHLGKVYVYCFMGLDLWLIGSCCATESCQSEPEFSYLPMSTAVTWRDVDGKVPMLISGSSDGGVSCYTLHPDEADCHSM